MLFLIKSTYHHLSTYVVDSIPFGLTNIGFKSVFFSRETRKQKYILLIFLFSFRIGLKPQSFKIFYCIDKVWTAGEIVVSSRSCSRPRWQRCLLCNVFAEVFASDQAASRRRTQVQDHCVRWGGARKLLQWWTQCRGALHSQRGKFLHAECTGTVLIYI